MSWKKFSVKKLVFSLIVLIIGIILKFPVKFESLPLQYKILGIGPYLTQSQYYVIEIISYLLIILSVMYLIILIITRK